MPVLDLRDSGPKIALLREPPAGPAASLDALVYHVKYLMIFPTSNADTMLAMPGRGLSDRPACTFRRPTCFDD
jgi:hypothetical protein